MRSSFLAKKLMRRKRLRAEGVAMGGEEALEHCDAQYYGLLVYTILDGQDLNCLSGDVANLME
jgi:hypothetical protein